jgi:hypothetical protein
MELKIACTGKGVISHKSIAPFQGNLKRRGLREISKLCNSLVKHGITFPFFIWVNNQKNMCIDGHGRLLAFEKLESDGYKIPDVPYIEIFADNETEAIKKLLYANCRYGEMTYDLVMEFVGDYEINLDEYLLPCGKMQYDGNFSFDPGSFEIVIPKITDEIIAAGNKKTDQNPKFRLGKAIIEMDGEEAEMLNTALDNYNRDNNGLFGFVTEIFEGGQWTENSF